MIRREEPMNTEKRTALYDVHRAEGAELTQDTARVLVVDRHLRR